MRAGSVGERWGLGLRAIMIAVIAAAGCSPGEVEPASKVSTSGSAVATTPDKTKAGAPKDDSPPGMRKHIANPNIPQEPSPFRFADVTKDSGVVFRQVSGMTETHYYPTANGSGVAMFDYDGDGKLDLYFATCTMLPLGSAKTGPNRLFRNLGDWKFEDVTEESGLGFEGFCHGIVTADFDNDGDSDVFLACYGPNRLYRNDAGKFTDVSASAGIENMARTLKSTRKDEAGNEVEYDRPVVNWASGGAPLDYDRDGDLDLYVTIQGDWALPDDDLWCGIKDKNIRMYCSPREIRTAKHILFRNDGDWKFTDVTDAAGVFRPDGHGFGAVTADVNADGLIDIYVANDQTPNFLFLNNGDGTFQDATETSGAAYDDKGVAQSGMGVECEDVDGDGLPELFCTNFQNEYNTLYRNAGGGLFNDMTTFYGLAQDSRPWTGWGTALADFDSDGWPDNFVTNGYVDKNNPDIKYEEPPLLMRNVPLDAKGESRRFKLATLDVGSYFDEVHVGRGAAFGDLDDDGDIDIVVNHKDGAPSLLRNETPRGPNHWIRLKLVGTSGPRDAIGTRVEVKTSTLPTIYRQSSGGKSMLSTNDPRLTIGVGPATVVEELTVRWASGKVTTKTGLDVDQAYTIEEPRE